MMNESGSGTPATKVSVEMIDRVTARLAARSTTSGRTTPATPSYDALHEAAAVLGWFDPATIRTIGGPVDHDSLDQLMAHSVDTVDAGGMRRRTITPDIRVAVLRQLKERGRTSQALAANPPHTGDPLRQTMAAYLSGHVKPVDEQSLTELESTSSVCEWLRAAGFEGLPERNSIQRRIDWLSLLEPFEHLAGPSFRGRARELERLRAYVGVLPPGSAAQATRRLVERVFNLKDKPPFLIYGPGGIGKSTLVARFILEHTHALEQERFPFAYLDFDRPDVDASEPLTLLVEALRQIGIEYADARESCENIRRGWIELLAKGQPRARTQSAAVLDFATLLEALGTNDRPVLLVLDTFEEVQFRSEENVSGVWRLLEELQPAISRLRICLVGRAPLPGRRTDDLALEGFDEEAAIGYLQARGVSDPAAARKIARQVGGSPLSLHLAAEVVAQEGSKRGKLDLATREFLFTRLDDNVIQRELYRRVLGHIHDPTVRKLAHPGLALRRLTPDLILKVIAKPCGIEIDSLDEARVLFDKLRREVSLVSLSSDGALVNRPDVRMLMLHLLERDEPNKTREIREGAVSYYQERPPDPRERAEEIYYRLTLGHQSGIIDSRWMAGVQPYLASALSELTGARRAYLAGRLGLEVDEETRRLADVEDWELVVGRKARDLLADGRPAEVLELIGSRSERTSTSPLYALEATALMQLGRWYESLDVLESGVEDALANNERQQALTLVLRQADIEVIAALESDEVRAMERLDELIGRSSSYHDRLDAVAHQLALARLVTTDHSDYLDLPAEIVEHDVPAEADRERATSLEQPLRRVFDETPDDVLTDDPQLAHLVASFFGLDDVARLSRVLRLSGLPRIDSFAVRRLAAALATFDVSVSVTMKQAPGALAAEMGFPTGEALTPAWGSYLLSATDIGARDALSRLLDEHATQVPAELMDAFADLMRSDYLAGSWAARQPTDSTLRPSRPRDRQSLSPSTRQSLAAALASAFPSPDSLREFLRYRLDMSLDAIAPNVSTYMTVLLAVVDFAQTRGLLNQLVVSARESMPASAALADVALELGLSTIVPAATASLERIVTAESSFGLGSWRERLAAIEGQVCRIEVNQRTYATGHLVGVDLVLTADHVLGPLDAPGVSLKDVQVRFDYQTDRRGSTVAPGTVFQVDDIVARSAYGQQTDQLGYALVHVAGAPGALPIGGSRSESTGALRSWIHVSNPPPDCEPGMGLVMVDYPLGQPLRMDLQQNAVLGISQDGGRVYYRLDASPGSSGAPCFTVNLDLVAFHVGTSMVDGRAPRDARVGVLLSAVLGQLDQKGLGGLLGTVMA